MNVHQSFLIRSYTKTPAFTLTFFDRIFFILLRTGLFLLNTVDIQNLPEHLPISSPVRYRLPDIPVLHRIPSRINHIYISFYYSSFKPSWHHCKFLILSFNSFQRGLQNSSAGVHIPDILPELLFPLRYVRSCDIPIPLLHSFRTPVLSLCF